MSSATETKPPNKEQKPAAKRRPSGSFCSITALSFGNETHHYVPIIPKVPKAAVSGCRITAKNSSFADYRYIYPYIGPDRKPTLLTEFDFHVKMAHKYKALLGETYLYPILGMNMKIERDQLVELTKEDTRFLDIVILQEIEIMIPGGIETVLANQKKIGLFICGKRGHVYPAGLKVILNKTLKELQNRRRSMNVADDFHKPADERKISEPMIEQFIAGLEIPDVRKLRDLLGINEDPEDLLKKMEALGILDSYRQQLDMMKYYDNQPKSRTFDFGDWREWKDDVPIDFSEWEVKDDSRSSSSRSAGTSRESSVNRDESFGSDYKRQNSQPIAEEANESENVVMVCDLSAKKQEGAPDDLEDDLPPLIRHGDSSYDEKSRKPNNISLASEVSSDSGMHDDSCYGLDGELESPPFTPFGSEDSFESAVEEDSVDDSKAFQGTRSRRQRPSRDAV